MSQPNGETHEPFEEIDAFDLHRIGQELWKLRGEAGRRAVEIRDRAGERKKTKKLFEQERARVRHGFKGTAQAKDDAVALDETASKLLDASDTAEVAEDYAKRMAKAHETDVSILQTMSSNAKAVMGIAGAGER